MFCIESVADAYFIYIMFFFIGAMLGFISGAFIALNYYFWRYNELCSICQKRGKKKMRKTTHQKG
jgi:hypothetical protein